MQDQLADLDSDALRSNAEQLSQQLQRLNAQLDDALGAPSPLPAPVGHAYHSQTLRLNARAKHASRHHRQSCRLCRAPAAGSPK